jgi:hypothetical protein
MAEGKIGRILDTEPDGYDLVARFRNEGDGDKVY